MAFYQLFLASFRGIYRNYSGLFWTLLMPAAIYTALSVLPVGKLSGVNFAYPAYLLPGILAMQIMQGGIYGLAYWLVDLKARGVIKRFLVTPIRASELVLAVLCSRIVVMLMQFAAITLIGVGFFRAVFMWNVFSIVFFIFLGGAIFLLLGLFIASFADTYEAAAPLTAGIGLPLTFLGNIFYPVESLPAVLQAVAKVLPVTYLADALRQLYLKPWAETALGLDAAVLALWLAAIFALILWRLGLNKEIS